MADFAALVRIFEPSPDDDFVDKRRKAVLEIKEKIRTQKKTAPLLAYANGLAEAFVHGDLPEPLASEVEGALRNASSAFVRDGQRVQMLVCALAAAQELRNECEPTRTGWSPSEVFLAATLSSLSGLTPHKHARIDELRREIVAVAATLVESTAETARRRLPRQDFVINVVDTDTPSALAAKVKSAADKVIAPLHTNALIDREELDLLWWALSDWSEALKCRISTLDPAVGLLASSLETVARLRRMPATAHAHIALKNVRKGAAMTVTQLVEATAKLTEKEKESLLSDFAGSDDVSLCPRVFPTLSALLTLNTGEGADAELDQLEWCKRLILEAGILKLQLPAAL